MSELKYTKTWFLDSEILKNLRGFIDTSQKIHALEIGCYEGLSSAFFAEILLNHNESTLTCVDPFLTIEDNDHKQYLTNNEEKNFDHNVSICRNSEKITVRKITSDKFF
jgi:predicted O-methyltransferase YrrM